MGCALLPPAYVVRTTGGYVFTGVCLFNFGGGGTPSQVWMGGYPIPGLYGRGVPGVSSHARSGWWGGTLRVRQLRGGRYASCVHAEGLSCVNLLPYNGDEN